MNWRISIAMAFAALSAFAEPGDDPVSLKGVVTLMRDHESYFFMRADDGLDWRISLKGEAHERFARGDKIDVDGLLEPRRNRNTTRVFEAVVQKTGHDESAVPDYRSISMHELWLGRDKTPLPSWYGNPVRVEGMVHDFWRTDISLNLVLSDRDDYIQCKVTVPISVPLPEYFKRGARIEVKGIAVYSASWGDGHVLVGFENVNVLTQGMDTITVVSRPPFWTVGRLVALLGVVLGALGALFVWNMMMRSAVRRALAVREKAVRDKAAAEAVVRERLRLSHDLHDNFQQLLASCAFSLAATTNYVKSDAPKDEILSALRDVEDTLQHTQAGLRAALWSINEEAEGPSRFSGLIRYAAGRLAHWAGVVDFSFSGRETPMARQHAGALLMVLQEAVANAIRHGRARKVHVAVVFEDRALEMSIVDDGVGFDQDSAEVHSPGHMGLSGMRARVENLGGTFRVESRTGEGTRIVIRMPL